VSTNERRRAKRIISDGNGRTEPGGGRGLDSLMLAMLVVVMLLVVVVVVPVVVAVPHPPSN